MTPPTTSTRRPARRSPEPGYPPLTVRAAILEGVAAALQRTDRHADARVDAALALLSRAPAV